MGSMISAAESALAVTQPQLGIPLRILGAVKSAGAAVTAWVIKSPIHILVALLVVAIAGNMGQWHAADQLDRASAAQLLTWQANFAKMRNAYLVDAHSLDLVVPALQRQNAAVRHMGDQVAAIGAAEASAAASATVSIAHARAISDTGRAEALTWRKDGQNCHTGPAGQAAAKQGVF